MDTAAEVRESIRLLTVALKTASAVPRPNYSIDGQSVSYLDYIKQLADAIKVLTELLGSLEPVEVRSSVL